MKQRATVWDDAGFSDAITVSMKNVPAPSDGTELVAWLISDYEAWLVPNGSTVMSLGAMEWADETVSHTFDSDSPGLHG